MKKVLKEYRAGIVAVALLSFVALAALNLEVREAKAQFVGDSFNCTMISTATALTELTNCAALTRGSYYITKINWSSSIISTTTNFMTVQSGTGSACATATTTHYAGFISAAFDSVDVVYPTPIKVPALHALCFVHPGAGTRNVNISGFIR